MSKNSDKKGWPAKKQVSNPNENYGTKERMTRPKGADQMNENFGKPGTDQDIIREAQRSAQTGSDQDESGR
jgi:hypothetical protein